MGHSKYILVILVPKKELKLYSTTKSFNNDEKR